jgi:hypothetical protein
LTQDRESEAQPLLTEARQILEQLGATVWLDRLDLVQVPEVGVTLSP